ncbi:hypothetical protein HMI56_001767 [Coelomomyces lativittatus]|nr:hypothetical protein HMI56_001767 [Coelomomyces lativittatus]
MIGDVNLFLNDSDDPHCAEIEVMIAEPSARGKGLATQSLIWMMAYGAKKLQLRKYKAIIGWENQASQYLFTKKLGFQPTLTVPVFKETHYELQWNQFGMDCSHEYIELKW